MNFKWNKIIEQNSLFIYGLPEVEVDKNLFRSFHYTFHLANYSFYQNICKKLGYDYLYASVFPYRKTPDFDDKNQIYVETLIGTRKCCK